MAATEDRDTLGRARLSFADEADIDQFVTMLNRFESGEIGPDEWRTFRLLRQANLRLLRALEPRQWESLGIHAERDAITVTQLARPSACPKCHSQHLMPPVFRVVEGS